MAVNAADQSGPGIPDEPLIYKVELPWEWRWTTDYAVAFQHATGLTLAEARACDDADAEWRTAEERISVLSVSPRVVSCVYCDETLSESFIASHHAREHPRERYNPAYYFD